MPASKWRGVVAGINDDDCGIIKFGGAVAVLTADYLNASPIAEELGLGDEQTLGFLSVAATISDLCGSGAKPVAILAAVTVPHGYPEIRFRRLMSGMQRASVKWNVPIIGGDTKLGHCRTILTSGLGIGKSTKNLFIKNRAQVGDDIWVSGPLGTCAAATHLIANIGRRERWAVDAITRPEVPVEKAMALSEFEIINGGMDVTDGLGLDLADLCRASCVGAVVRASTIPVHAKAVNLALESGLQPWSFAFASGGDYQIVVTARRRVARVISNLGFSRIGTITRKKKLFLEVHGRLTDWPGIGHEDRRKQSFKQEIARISAEVSRRG